ncbi:AmmeMemoRadiSam system protein B [Methylogaea oryzae]|uniref:MEMO1 family protein MoryE10_06720 n=1 Tax=Methylogaea oryzae TaxID=1295382 RepID=A0A8D5AJH6_9GAMM|nr:AmmeMemoRadiSam system protein B [Methylogaea oryzae]BBL70066.1 MEMO1 family protein [Methylogaea oryzae]
MTSTRHPAVAGSFYPADAAELHRMLQGFLAVAPTDPLGPPKAIIAPHAGYVYSGPVAASVYAQLRAAADRISRVVLLGPSHRVAFRGIAASSADYFATPLGSVPLDRAALDTLSDLPFVHILDQAHGQEHSLEVHLPFLQEVLKCFSLVPLVAGDAPPEQIAAVLERLWGGEETLIVVSSDLSHYHSYTEAQHMDSATSAAIAQLRYQDLDYQDACGRVPVSGLLYAAQRRGLRCKVLDLRNSGDTAGPRDQVVGYGAYAFH